MFLPKSVKYKKQHRNKKKNRINTYFTLNKYKFGVLGIRSVEFDIVLNEAIDLDPDII